MFECAMCGRPAREHAQDVYGALSCRRCWAGFAGRRQLAFFLDIVIIDVIVVVLVAAARILVVPEASDVPDSLAGAGIAAGLLLTVSKDALFSGRSPAKALLGLRVVDSRSGKRITAVQSLQRNMVLLVPFVPVVVAFHLKKGLRLGDGAANTRVVWDRYRDSPAFVSAPVAA